MFNIAAVKKNWFNIGDRVQLEIEHPLICNCTPDHRTITTKSTKVTGIIVEISVRDDGSNVYSVYISPKLEITVTEIELNKGKVKEAYI